MPAVSKKQQRFFGMVHAYQKGKIPADKVSAAVKKVAGSISPEDSKKYATTQHAGLKEIRAMLESPTYVHETLKHIVESNAADKVKGQLLDMYTSKMILTVLNKLNENNRNALLSKPVNEMVAVAYKMLTY